MSFASYCLSFVVSDSSAFVRAFKADINTMLRSINLCRVSVKLSLARLAPQYIKNVTDCVCLFSVATCDMEIPHFPPELRHFAPLVRSSRHTALCLVFMLILMTLPRLKMCNLNPTETSTCRRCQSDSGRATLPSGLQHLFGL